MRLVYVLLSPTFGMHQYTADLANRMARAGHQVHLVTTTTYPCGRYAPEIAIHTPVSTRNTGFSADGLRFWAIPNLKSEILNLKSDAVHFTGPHLWNPVMLASLRRAGIPTVHTIHDVNPHTGAGYGKLLYMWNNLVYRLADHILVHGQVYRKDLLARGISPGKITCTPLLHLFLSYESEQMVSSRWQAAADQLAANVPTSALRLPPSALGIPPFVLFFARLETYKGVNVLVEAMRLIEKSNLSLPPSALRPLPSSTAIIAGKGNLDKLFLGPLPANVEIRNRLIGDEEAIDLFTRCSLVVLPYVEASQSAVIAAAYFFGKPVIVTRVGALPEYVVEGQTGWIVPPDDARVLADCLRAALSDPARLAQMGQTGRAWYQAQRKAEMETLQAMYMTLSTNRR